MVAWARRPVLMGAVVAVVLTAALTMLVGRAVGDGTSRCERFDSDARTRAATVTGRGERVVVIGDSWSAGLGLDDPAASWPRRLPGRVHVAGFSGSGFSEHASPCSGVAFADRAPAALRRGADLVVVEGGLNDFDRPAAEVRAGFARLMRSLPEARVVIVGPARAPARARGALRVDALLADLAAAYDVPYVRTAGLDLPYLDDRLHLTRAGHRAFGNYVADAIAGLDS